MRTFFYYILAIVAIMPCLLILNESDNLFVNILGFAWVGILIIASRTKVGKTVIKAVLDVNKKMCNWLEK